MSCFDTCTCIGCVRGNKCVCSSVDNCGKYLCPTKLDTCYECKKHIKRNIIELLHDKLYKKTIMLRRIICKSCFNRV